MHASSQANPNERLLRYLGATSEQQAAIDRILAGQTPSDSAPQAPLLLGMGAAAALLGVSRATLWRMLNAGRLSRVEVLPGSYRVRRAELEAFAKGAKT
jgi:excisionase family DNA binding protein